MQYEGEEALGLIETLGMVPAVYGADAMLKAAAVELAAYENVGSTLVTIMVRGDVAAVRASVDAGAAAASSIGKLTARNVMPRPVRGVGSIARVHALDPAGPPDSLGPVAPLAGADPGLRSLGMIETFGIVYLMEAADAMIKAADVQLLGYENVASGYCSVLVQGDVAACTSAVEAGIRAVKGMDGNLYSSCVIAVPHPDLAKVVRRYALS